MSTRIAAKGAIVKSGASATPTVTLAGLRSAALTIGTRAMIKATCHDDTVTDSYIPAPLRDTNSIDLTIAYDPADTSHEAVRAAHAAGTAWYFTLILPDAGSAQWALLGTITDFSVPALNPETGLIESNIKFKATAADTFTQ